jgi:hypothetical protein
MISEIFSTSFLFRIAIIVTLVGGLFVYFNHKLSEQNHKMQSMLGLVSTMAEEMQYFRSKLNSRPDEHNRMPDADIIQFIPNFLGGKVKVEDNDLIEVSDSESVEDDECDSDCDSECDSDDEDSDLECDSDDSIDEDINSDDEEVEEINNEEENEGERKIISIDLGINNEFMIESEDINEDINEANNEIKSVNLEDIDMSLKSISIDGFSDISFSNNKGKGEYKKLSLSKLREVVIEKGLVIDSSKLKKNELLKMLGDE